MNIILEKLINTVDAVYAILVYNMYVLYHVVKYLIIIYDALHYKVNVK